MGAGLVEIVSSAAMVRIAPAAGGAITRYTRAGPSGPRDLLRPAPSRAVEGRVPTDMSCFPLVPFSNRIRNGRFHFQGRDVRLPPNFPPEPHAIHGHGWQASWDVVEVADDRAVISYRHPPDEWPYPYTARQDFLLVGDSLRVTLSVSNDGAHPMPAGFGLHPYFVRTPQTRITAAVDAVWLSDDDAMPTRLVPLPDDRRLDRGIDPDEVPLDHNFVGWDGTSVVEWLDRGGRLTMTARGPFGVLVVYTPSGEEFACVEPVTNVIDAFNQARHRSDTGMLVLGPGEEAQGTVTFTPEDVA